MKRDKKFKNLISTVSNFFVFFLLAAFVTTCCIMLFISALQGSIGREFTQSEITLAAKITMVNVVLISIGMAAIDYFRRKITVERPVKRITAAASKMIKGDFSVRIAPVARIGTDDSFNEIIECINKMAEELSGVETLRTDFVANVSHEMKTPLAVMQNYGRLLKEPDVPEEKRMEYARAITDAAHRLSDMMTNILKLNRLENQQIYPNFTEFDLGEQLCEALLQYESVWERKNIEFDADMDSVEYFGCESLMYHVWSNLLSNAIKFSPEGGTVKITIERGAGVIDVSVADSGPGISDEAKKRIFDKFYQADTSHKTEGNGLGLALVKEILVMEEGGIFVDSSDLGAKFTVRLKEK